MFGFSSSGALYYNLTFLELYPDYICDFKNGTIVNPCNREDFCPIEFEPEVNWESTTSLHNLVEILDLKCKPSYLIGLFGSSYFIGWVIAGIIIPRLGDIYGRKWLFIGSYILQCIASIIILLSTNTYLTISLFFVLGTG